MKELSEKLEKQALLFNESLQKQARELNEKLDTLESRI